MELKLRDIKINELDESCSIERDEILGKLFEQMQDNLESALHDAMANYLGRDPVDDDFKRTHKRPNSPVYGDVYCIDDITLLVVKFESNEMVILSHFLPENWQPKPPKQYQYLSPGDKFKDGDEFSGDGGKTWMTLNVIPGITVSHLPPTFKGIYRRLV